MTKYYGIWVQCWCGTATRTLNVFNAPEGAILTQPDCWEWTRRQPVTYTSGSAKCGADFDDSYGYNRSGLNRTLYTMTLSSETYPFSTLRMDEELGPWRYVRRIELRVESWGNGPYYIPAWRMWWGVGLEVQQQTCLGWGVKQYPGGPTIPATLWPCPQPPYDSTQKKVWTFEVENLDRIRGLVTRWWEKYWTVPFFIALADECHGQFPSAHVPSPMWDLEPSWRTPHWLNDMLFYPSVRAYILVRLGPAVTPLSPGPMSGRPGRGGPGLRSSF